MCPDSSHTTNMVHVPTPASPDTSVKTSLLNVFALDESSSGRFIVTIPDESLGCVSFLVKVDSFVVGLLGEGGKNSHMYLSTTGRTEAQDIFAEFLWAGTILVGCPESSVSPLPRFWAGVFFYSIHCLAFLCGWLGLVDFF